MGRYSTSAITTGKAIRIELSYIIKNGFIKKSFQATGSLNRTDGSNVSFASSYIPNKRPYVRLAYIVTQKDTGEETHYDYKIYLEAISSNLGI